MTKQSDANAQEIAALKARIEELEKATAPEPPVDMTGFSATTQPQACRCPDQSWKRWPPPFRLQW